MFGFVRQHAVFLFYSLVLHAGVVALLTFSFVRSASHPTAPPQIMVEATVVDAAAISRWNSTWPSDCESRLASDFASRF